MNETLEKAEKLLAGQIEDLEHQLELFNEYIRGHEALVKQLFGVDSGSSEEISMNSTISPFIFEIKKGFNIFSGTYRHRMDAIEIAIQKWNRSGNLMVQARVVHFPRDRFFVMGDIFPTFIPNPASNLLQAIS